MLFVDRSVRFLVVGNRPAIPPTCVDLEGDLLQSSSSSNTVCTVFVDRRIWFAGAVCNKDGLHDNCGGGYAVCTVIVHYYGMCAWPRRPSWDTDMIKQGVTGQTGCQARCHRNR